MLLRTKTGSNGLLKSMQVGNPKGRFHYERRKKHSLFVLLLFFCARFNRRSIKERKNAIFHARSGNGPLQQAPKKKYSIKKILCEYNKNLQFHGEKF